MRCCLGSHFLRLVVVGCLSAAWTDPAIAPARGDESPEKQPPRDLYSDTWVATDGLGRRLPDHQACGPPRQGKHVGIFYFLWLGQHGTGGPYDITKITDGSPDQPAWGPPGAFHHWGEPQWGYYLSTDAFVIRKHAHALADAGVDVLFFDVTNGPTYEAAYLAVCRVFRTIREEGHRTPQIAFLTNSHSDQVVRRLYEGFYTKGLYRELWFVWQGKPLMLAKTDGLSREIRDFFTFRQSWAWSGTAWFGDGRDKWPWLDHYPQQPGWHEPGKPEQMPVAVAQHPITNIGRSFHAGHQPPPSECRTDEGLCFAEQWERALQVDPQMIFITGWNEWVAQRFVADRAMQFLGQPIPQGETYFVDQYNREFSRDIEPMRGGHGDNYYYQMAANIRRYKGVRPLPKPGPPQEVTIDGDFAEWRSVEPEFRDTAFDTVPRDQPGWGSAGRYVDRTGRNDFVTLKVADDPRHVAFYAETRGPISPHTDPRWMLLFLDADCDPQTGWQGYDYVVNHQVAGPRQSTLQRIARDGRATPVAEIPLAVAGNRLELKLPRELLGAEGGLKFDFHWADNPQRDFDLAEFTLHGDSAPNGRFNYRYHRRLPSP
ncbi:MAG: hypothetical protein JXB62_17175 [Pirellulales bacterium]|nr:hypothetical protein [Pirellulales bacterium]